MNKVYGLEGGTIVIYRKLDELDFFLKSFLDVLKKYSDFLVVSGFVSISTGRTRATEDIDVLVPQIAESEFKKLFEDLVKNNFWCYQGDSSEEIYEYVKSLNNIRFAKSGTIFPNIEFIPINQTKKAQYYEFTHPQKIRVDTFEFKIPPIEFEILYKELILGSKKDLEDAKHLRTVFSELIKKENFELYEPIIRRA